MFVPACVLEKDWTFCWDLDSRTSGDSSARTPLRSAHLCTILHSRTSVVEGVEKGFGGGGGGKERARARARARGSSMGCRDTDGQWESEEEGSKSGSGRSSEEEGSKSGRSSDLAEVLPRVLIVSRRTLRKKKFVDFVGEYHLDLIVAYGAVPVIVPRVSGLHSLLDSFEPIHGVLLCEGEDIDPELYESDLESALTASEIEEIRQAHASDTSLDKHKDSIELQLARRCLERNIPYLGICRGSQVLNVACGGSLYQDVERQLSSAVKVKHMDYDNYDGHRHAITVVPGTPLHDWFQESLSRAATPMELIVNSYHHQGVKRLAGRFKPMAFAPDGLTEAFYDPDAYHPEQGGFIVGLQFHPERMRHEQDADADAVSADASSDVFDYPECPRAYQEFVKAVVAYQKRLLATKSERRALIKLDGPLEEKRQKIVRSFSIAKHIYEEQVHVRKSNSVHDSELALKDLQADTTQSSTDLEFGARFLQSNTVLNGQQVTRLLQMGATFRNSSLVIQKLHMNKKNEAAARTLMESMDSKRLLDLLEYHKMMCDVAQSVMDKRKLHEAPLTVANNSLDHTNALAD